MRFSLLLNILTWLFFNTIISQEIPDNNRENIFSVLDEISDTTGNVNIYQDFVIEELVLKHIEKNKEANGMSGYRINIFSESGQNARQRWIAVKDTFDKYYPEIPSYREYQEPNFKIYVGDFRTKVDALKFHKTIDRIYPKSFIVNTRINFPKITEE